MRRKGYRRDRVKRSTEQAKDHTASGTKMSDLPRLISRERIGGFILIGTGCATAVAGWSYRIGTVREMGAGFMPLALGVLLCIVGLALLVAPDSSVQADALDGGVGNANAERWWRSSWRGPMCIVLAVAAFVALGNVAGLVAASFGSIYLAALADRRNSQRDALILSTAGTVVSVLLFHYALSLQLPLFGGNGL
jgi:hypothetical protein